MLNQDLKTKKGINMKHIKKVKQKSSDNSVSPKENGGSNPIRYARPCIPVDGN